MQNEKMKNFLFQIQEYWQILAFTVFFLGYLTFAFYMQINGFSFIVPDLTFLIAFGLIMTLLSLPVILLIQYGHTNVYLVMFISAIIPMLFQNFNIMIIFMIIIGAIQVNSFLEFSSSDNNQESKKKKEKIIDKTAIILTLIMLLIVDWRYSFIVVINMIFFSIMEIHYKNEKIINPAHVIFYLLSLSYSMALLIDAKGFNIANMQKTEINFKIDDNKSISGSLIYNDSENFYIYEHDQNQSISIAKDKVINIVKYDHQEPQSKNIIEIVKDNLSPFLIKSTPTTPPITPAA